jgi:RHS repeat-associated protein
VTELGQEPVVTSYVHDGIHVIAEYNGEGELLKEYVYSDNIDEVLNIKDGTENFFPHLDGLNSVVAVTDADGERVASYNYEAFGTIKDATGALDNNITYTGRWLEPETGDYFYRARYYDSGIGRFLKRDKVGVKEENINVYFYVSNNPINYIDIDGNLQVSVKFDTPSYKGKYYVNPHSKKHTHRNRKNKCPVDPPCEKNGRVVDFNGYPWIKDNPFSSKAFHGGPKGDYKTFRAIRPGKYAGSQCTYNKDGELIDSGKWMGTYDYEPSGTLGHVISDVNPHKINPNYASGKTRTYCRSK